MVWSYLAIGTAAAGLIPLAYLTARLWAATRELGRELDRMRRLLEPGQRRLAGEIAALRRGQG